MALTENPKKIAQDVAEGLQSFNSANLRRYEVQDLKIIVDNMNALQQEIRQEIVAANDPEYTDKMKAKNMRMSRIRNAITVMRTFAHRHGKKVTF